jgi:hypothetical protein
MRFCFQILLAFCFKSQLFDGSFKMTGILKVSPLLQYPIIRLVLMDRVLQFICVSDFVFLFLFCVYVETLEPEVKILSLAIKSPGRADIVLPITDNGNHKGLWFTLKEGSRYSLNFTFQVSNNIVSGLKYTNTVWKTGMKGKLSLSLSLSCTQTRGLYAKESGRVTLDLRNQCFSVL